MMTVFSKKRSLAFVVCANDPRVLSQRLLASPCMQNGEYDQAIYLHASSAAAAFNAEIVRGPDAQWLVWVHQDVFLPAGWDVLFCAELEKVRRQFENSAVVGVYGIAGAGASACRAGRLLDRGALLKEPAALPCRVDSLDDLLFGVRTDSGLQLDPALGFHFYATDIALAARERGLDVVVVDAYCQHWSTTPREGISPLLLEKVVASAEVFERKWAHRLPVDTPCFSIGKPGDVALFCQRAR